MQYRNPVGRGPSGKTWPRCPLQRAQCTSVRSIPRVRSVVVSTASGIGAKKLGHPVRLSNFVSEVKSSWPHARTTENPVTVLRVQRTRAGALGAVLAENVKLFRRQFCAPFLVVLWNVHLANLPDSIDFEE